MPALTITAVRLGAVEALCPTAALVAGSGFPTIARDQVFDSKMLPETPPQPGEPGRLMMAVYTEVAKGDRRGEAQWSRPLDFVVDLVVEAQVAIHVEIEDGDGFGPMETDAAAEATLDFLTVQVRRVITDATTNGGALHRIVKSIAEVESWPLRLPDVGVRLARRTMRMRVECGDDDWKVAGGLPEPLATLRARLPTESYAAGVLDRIAAAIGPEPVPPALDEIRVGGNLGKTPPDDVDGGEISGGVDFTP